MSSAGNQGTPSGDNSPASNVSVGTAPGGNNVVDPHNLQELTQFVSCKSFLDLEG